MKRKFIRFWKEWGITKEELAILIASGLLILVLPFILSVLGAII